MKKYFEQLDVFSVFIAASCLGLVGCAGLSALYLPAQKNSHDVAGETVSLKMLNGTNIVKYADAWQAAFGVPLTVTTPPPPKEGEKFLPLAAFAAPLAAEATGLLVGYVTNGLNQEASLYTAQFGRTRAFDSFWQITPTGTNVNYYGFEIIRTTKNHQIKDANQPENTAAFDLVCGIRPSSDQKVVEIAPLRYARNSSKAKVLDITWWSWFVPPFIQPLFLLPKHGTYVKTSVDIEVDAIWVSGNEQVNLNKVAAFTIDLPDADLDKPKVLYASSENSLGESSGWVGGIPFSAAIAVSPNGITYAGTFTLKATVTEKDPSNAQQDLQKLGTLIGSQDQKIIAIVTNAVGSATAGR